MGWSWRALPALAAAAAVLGGGQALAHTEQPMNPEESLVEVTATNRTQLDQLAAKYDLAEYLRKNDDGTLTANVYATDGELAQIRAEGYEIGATIEDTNIRLTRLAEREASLSSVELSKELAENGVPKGGIKHKGKSVIPTPGEVSIQRADTFTNYAGRFLYVEAHSTLGTTSTSTTANLSLSYAGADDVFGTATSMSRLTDSGQYMYHQLLVRLTDTEPVKVRVASSKGGVEETTPKEWLGGGLPPHVEGYRTGFFSAYMDPTQVYASLDGLQAEYPNLSEWITLPNKTGGYQRKSAATLNGTAAINATVSGAAQGQAVVVRAQAWGQEGGNLVTAELKDPGAPSSPLSVAVSGFDITVNLATDASGALTSTAAQVVAAINASPEASALVSAQTYRGNAGAGIAQPRAKVALSDFLAAPAHVQRGPFTQRALRIGKQRDGSKVGVFIYCQQHAREWATPLTCLETAHRLLVNYATDAKTKELLDELDVFILPVVNPDGAHYSFYDFASQRKNMTNYCAVTGNSDPAGRNSWGVDLNRNNGSYSLFDGYSGAGTGCTGETYAGPFENSEPEIKNEQWIVDTFANIKFAINIHSYGGYFMWAPGSYIANGRITAPAPNIGVEKYFFDAADNILKRIKEYRGTAILPERTGPIADVLYSAAGNSADDQWYRKGIISYSFETGADRFTSTTSGIAQTAVGFMPNFASEGSHEAMEFANGNFGLLESALEYSRDTAAPVVDIDSDGVTVSKDPINYRFNWVNEPSVIHYTTDGSTPTLASPTYENARARGLGQILTVSAPGTTTVKWLAKDIKGNVSAVKSQTFMIDQTAPTMTMDMPEGAVFTQGKPVRVSYSCADEGGSGVASCTGTVPSGGLLDTSTPGTFPMTVAARDGAGNETVETHMYTVIPAVNMDGTVGGSVGPTLSLTLGPAASFGTFTPGIDRTYSASTTANVVSTAGDAALTVSGPTRLANGAFSLTEPVQVSIAPAAWSGPVSNAAVAIAFSQHIGANEPLRTGSYGATLTFTLSTTQP